jgi:hypothetical protein
MTLRCQKLVTNHSDPTYYSPHFFAATLVSFWLTLCQTNAQSRETSFGQIRTSAIPTRVDRFSLTTRVGKYSVLYCWAQHGTVLVSAVLDSTGSATRWEEHQLPSPVDEFMVADFPFEGKKVGVVIDKSERRLSFFNNLSTDTLKPVTTLQVPVTPGGVVFGDLNNDKRTDFVLFDRDTPGAIPYFGIGNEQFRQGKVFAPDNAIGGLRLVHLNNDGLLDIVFYDWVRSEIHLLYGVGQGKFLDQANIAIDGEVRDFAVTPLIPNGNLDIILACRRPSKLEILQGDDLGDFRLNQRIGLRESLLSLAIVDINNDGYKDIVGLDGSSVLHTFLNSGDNTFEDYTDFVVGKESGQFTTASLSLEGPVDAVLLDRGSQQLITLLGAHHNIWPADSVDYSTGVRPRGLTIGDVNGDGLNDITVVTGGSNSIAFYLNRQTTGLSGQSAYPLPASAHDVAFHSLRDSTARFLISYPDSKQVSVFTLDERERSATNATIGTERAVEFLYWNGLRKPAIDFFSFSPPVSSIPASLTLFEEIESHQFIEQNFRLQPSTTLLGAGVGRLNNDSIPDVAYIYRNNASGKIDLAVSLGDSLHTYKQKSFSIELPEKNVNRSYVWIVDVGLTGRPDIVFLQEGTPSMLERVRWIRENTYSRPDTLAADLKIVDWSQLQFVDLDGDGRLDIVVHDAERGQIGWMKGDSARFDAFRPLCDAPLRSHFALGDLNGDGVPDLAVTHSDTGTLRVYDGRSLLRRSLEGSH